MLPKRIERAHLDAPRRNCSHLWYHQVSKIRRGGYVFISWIGDHDPRHVHVYKDGKLLAKWDLDGWRVMQGQVTTRLIRLLEELRDEGRL
jgi:hypothetical protein